MKQSLRLGLIAVVMAALGLMVIPSGKTSAHHPMVEGSAVCSEGLWVVTWTVSNGDWESRNMTIKSVSRPVGSIQVDTVVAPNDSVSGTESIDGSTTGKIIQTVVGDWDKHGPTNVTGEGEVNLPVGGCQPPEETVNDAWMEQSWSCETQEYYYEVKPLSGTLVSPIGRVTGKMTKDAQDFTVTAVFEGGKPLTKNLSAHIPSLEDCGTKPPKPPVAEKVEYEEGPGQTFCVWSLPDNGGEFFVFWNQGDGRFQNIVDKSVHNAVGAVGNKFGNAEKKPDGWQINVFGLPTKLIGGEFTIWMNGSVFTTFKWVSGQPVFPRSDTGWDLTGKCQSNDVAIIWDQGPAGSDGTRTGLRFEVPAWNQGLPIALVAPDKNGVVSQMIGYAAMLPGGDDVGIHQSAMPRLGDKRDGLQVGMIVSIGGHKFVVTARQVMSKVNAAKYGATHTVLYTCTWDWQDNVVFTLESLESAMMKLRM